MILMVPTIRPWNLSPAQLSLEPIYHLYLASSKVHTMDPEDRNFNIAFSSTLVGLKVSDGRVLHQVIRLSGF